MRTFFAPSRSLHGWKRLAVALLAVPAILIGLLAMHFLTGNPSLAPDTHGPTSHASMAVGESVSKAAPTAHSQEVTDCDPLCGSAHDMLGMACILALLITALLLVVHLTLLRWVSLRSITSAILAHLAALAPPQPPSLFILSVSRT